MRFIVTVAVSVLLGAAFAPTLGPVVRDNINKGLTAAAQYVNENTVTKDTKTTVGPATVREKKTDAQKAQEFVEKTVSDAAKEVQREISKASSGQKK